MKTLMSSLDSSDLFETHIFITGLHNLSKYGGTWEEVTKQNYKNTYRYINQSEGDKMDIILSNTILGFSNYVEEIKPDLVIVHGDRIEPLAASIVAAFNNILVAHIEGGEISGTIDESIRHAISKLAHLHFVANEESENRLLQLGEDEKNIFIIGSPDIDVMCSNNIPGINEIKQRYDIPFSKYNIFMYHPVTTEVDSLKENIEKVVDGLLTSNEHFVVIYPNNDKGSDIILDELKRLEDSSYFRIIPSMRFEYFLGLLKFAGCIVGNSSAGIREAEIYGRCKNSDVIHINESEKYLLDALERVKKFNILPKNDFGDGKSTEKFFNLLTKNGIFKTSVQKKFIDR